MYSGREYKNEDIVEARQRGIGDEKSAILEMMTSKVMSREE